MFRLKSCLEGVLCWCLHSQKVNTARMQTSREGRSSPLVVTAGVAQSAPVLSRPPAARAGLLSSLRSPTSRLCAWQLPGKPPVGILSVRAAWLSSLLRASWSRLHLKPRAVSICSAHCWLPVARHQMVGIVQIHWCQASDKAKSEVETLPVGAKPCLPACPTPLRGLPLQGHCPEVGKDAAGHCLPVHRHEPT